MGVMRLHVWCGVRRDLPQRSRSVYREPRRRKMLGQERHFSRMLSALEHFAVVRSTYNQTSDVCDTFQTTDCVSEDNIDDVLDGTNLTFVLFKVSRMS
jgi:hypothetical protein